MKPKFDTAAVVLVVMVVVVAVDITAVVTVLGGDRSGCAEEKYGAVYMKEVVVMVVTVRMSLNGESIVVLIVGVIMTVMVVIMAEKNGGCNSTDKQRIR